MNQSPLSPDDCVVFQSRQQWYCYVPITKVSSTFLRRAIPGRQFNIHEWQWYHNSQDPVPSRDHMNYLVMLRDPIARWVSGLVEFWCRARPDRPWQPDQTQDWLLDTIEFDIHTQPQMDFLHAVDLDRCTWLWMDHAVENHIWFGDHDIVLNAVDPELRNRVNDHSLIYFGPDGQRSRQPVLGWPSSVPDHQIKAAIEYTLQHNPHAATLVQQYYAADYELIHRVNFY